MTQLGKILQFDGIRGYGFIAPDMGGSDVFVHANEFDGDESRLIPGAHVRFEVMDGGRGRKAHAVRIVEERDGERPAGPGAGIALRRAPPPGDHPPYDVLSADEMCTDLTEMILNNFPELTGAQIVRLRGDFLALARQHGWVEEE
ncbi:cold shock domain-containing protein [Actinomadura sp. DC4]|uniref:cold shock domain-containing protein n=1 Tax=Actinomadura sp. DC4 TaxID=3055069 RepID=UPI0025B1A740|nr:cold shock domain-containing protein [Actinomadura sp. DC4]MDN3353573.1 cold shock domain-containing protein [Actinomadura sp. DC4]